MINRILGNFAFIIGGIVIGYLLSELMNSDKLKNLKGGKKDGKNNC